MGVGRWSKCPISSSSYSDYYNSTPTNPGNPNPKRYNFLHVETIGKMLIVKIQYPDCSNYEGVKILVYKDVTLESLINQKEIDPHFTDNKSYISPVARFVPSPEGMELAKKFCRSCG